MSKRNNTYCKTTNRTQQKKKLKPKTRRTRRQRGLAAHSQYSSKSFKYNRQYKDALFRKIFNNKKDLLDIYNALNGSSFTDEEELTITTIDDAIYMGRKNDLSFLVCFNMNLYEHQSTPCPNAPLRGLIYFSNLYQSYLEMHDLDVYGESKLLLPTPRYIVFYNGTKDMEAREELLLSELFEKPGADKNTQEPPALECRATVININYPHNQELLKKCKRLEDYSWLVNRIQTNQAKKWSFEQSMEEAIDEAIKQGHLAEFLTKNRSEVKQMLLTEYNEERHMRTLIRNGEARTKTNVIKKAYSKIEPSEIADILDLSEASVKTVIAALTENPQIDSEQLMRIVMQ